MTSSTLSRPKPNVKSMADFRPFCGWRYQPQKTDVGKVIAPPYDILSAEDQKKLYERSPYNCVRLILNRREATDDANNNSYLRARDCFRVWREEQILIREPAPCFYLYRQTFSHPEDGQKRTRTALLGRLKLEPFENRVVIPHEKTLAAPRQDRKKLLEATRTNFSPVFGLYDDAEEISGLLKSRPHDAPLAEGEDEAGVLHRFWRIDDEDEVRSLHEALSDRKIYIADGHHRYQTALEYAQEMRKQKNLSSDTELASDFVLMALVGFQDPGLLLLPTHRLMLPHSGWNPDKALDSLASFFNIEPAAAEKFKDVLARSGHEDRGVRFGFILRKEGLKTFILTLREKGEAKEKMPKGRPDVWYDLDVNVLAYLVFAHLWHLEESSWESVLRFSQSSEEVLAKVRSGEAGAAFLLRPPELDILRQMGEARELMPQKSTYFYPKLASGLVFYHHEE